MLPSSAPDGAALASGPMRDRFVGFAFAASELLVETDSAGNIQFATGAFKRWFGLTADQMLGRPLASLASGPDQATVALCVSLAHSRGRVPPVGIQLATPQRTPMALAGLCRLDASNAICFTFGRMPVAGEPAGEAISTEGLSEALQRRINQGDAGTVGLIEIEGLPKARAGREGERGRNIREQISSQLAQAAGQDAMAHQLADGRFGVLADQELNVEDVVGQLKNFLNAIPEAANARVRGSGIKLLAPGELTAQQKSSAMRYALGRFAEGGLEATKRAGFENGLIGFVTHANERARSARAAIAAGKFKLRFQPIVSLPDGVIHHYEALLRPIATPQNPGENPQEFVSFVEAVGLAEELDLAVIRQTLDIMLKAPWASVAMNISGISAQSPDFRRKSVAMIHEAVSMHQLRPLIELTETVEITNVKEAATTMAELRNAGAVMCLDDFGAGAASYRYLRDFRVDFVKIDGSFVRQAETNARTHGMIVSIVELANFVGAKVIAEMVETEAQAKMMADAGIGFAQGWLFGKPGHLPGVVI